MKAPQSCPNCGTEFEEGWDVCWNCGSNDEGESDPEFVHADDVPEDNKGWITFLNVFGLISGLWSIQKGHESKRRFKWDFFIPDFVAAIGFGSFVIWLSFYLEKRRDFVFVTIIGGLIVGYGLLLLLNRTNREDDSSEDN